jgi:hypothetical protein
MSELTIPRTLSVPLPAAELPKGEREYQAFLRLLPGLLLTHRGKFVAIHDGQVVDSDTDEVALVLRVQARVGYIPLYVGLVTEQPLVVRIPHYREYRPQGHSCPATAISSTPVPINPSTAISRFLPPTAVH